MAGKGYCDHDAFYCIMDSYSFLRESVISHSCAPSNPSSWLCMFQAKNKVYDTTQLLFFLLDELLCDVFKDDFCMGACCRCDEGACDGGGTSDCCCSIMLCRCCLFCSSWIDTAMA